MSQRKPVYCLCFTPNVLSPMFFSPVFYHTFYQFSKTDFILSEELIFDQVYCIVLQLIISLYISLLCCCMIELESICYLGYLGYLDIFVNCTVVYIEFNLHQLVICSFIKPFSRHYDIFVYLIIYVIYLAHTN